MVVSWKDNRPDEYVELDRDRCYYVEVNGEMDMTEEEYDSCEEKYGTTCDDDLVVYENDNFISKDVSDFYVRCLKYNGINITDVSIIKRVQCNEDRW